MFQTSKIFSQRIENFALFTREYILNIFLFCVFPPPLPLPHRVFKAQGRGRLNSEFDRRKCNINPVKYLGRLSRSPLELT